MARYLITSALPYINGVKHLGNLIGSMLPADVFARFLRQNGDECLYICGTDEHGAPAEIAAAASNLDPQDYCDKLYKIQKDIYEKFNLAFDCFGRSSSQTNHELTSQIFLKLKENNYIEEKFIKQYYSFDDNRFLPDRFIEGTCPKCGYDKARGDQCDGCGVLLDPEDLIDPYSALSGSKNIEMRETKHVFFLLNKLDGKISDWISNQNWPEISNGIAKKWLKEGLQARCISRDLKWGIKVPLAGYEDKVFYVWFDAPNGYISITQDWAIAQGDAKLWEKWWIDNEEVKYYQFMAKDNVPFHAVFWPGMLIASGLPYKKVDYLKSFHWLTYEKGKFSTSRGTGIFMDTALELYPADYWRYYLLSICPETSDSDFSFSNFASVINKDLADVLGNFANRSLTILQKHFNLEVVALDESTLDKVLITKVKEIVDNISISFKELKFRAALGYIRSLWVLGNEYITEQKPWDTIKTDPKVTAITLSHCIHLLRLFAVVSYSAIPSISTQILQMLNDDKPDSLSKTSFEEGLDFYYFKTGHKINTPVKLFEKIDDDKITELTARFAGK